MFSGPRPAGTAPYAVKITLDNNLNSKTYKNLEIIEI